MEEKVLFEIPIYSMTRRKFDEKWEKKKDKLFQAFIGSGHSEESAAQGVSACYYPRWLWQYNQIVGYIRISVSRNDVLFDLFCSRDQRYSIDGKSKHFLENWFMSGTHFPLEKKTNEEIRADIRAWLREIEKEHIPKRFYVDYDSFNNILDFVDIRSIVDKL